MEASFTSILHSALQSKVYIFEEDRHFCLTGFGDITGREIQYYVLGLVANSDVLSRVSKGDCHSWKECRIQSHSQKIHKIFQHLNCQYSDGFQTYADKG